MSAPMCAQHGQEAPDQPKISMGLFGCNPEKAAWPRQQYFDFVSLGLDDVAWVGSNQTGPRLNLV